MMQTYMQTETTKHKNMYYNLTKVLEFERIFKECLASMWQTCEAQLTFWGHLQQASTVDFNLLDKDGEKIQKHAHETEELWESLCKINPCHSRAISKYTIYLREIRNNEQLSNSIKDKSKNIGHKKNLANIIKDNDILFDDKTAVIHVSGSKDAIGKILQTNKGILSVFGYTSNELHQNSVNKIMPGILGKRHNELMERYFKTGKSKVFNKERYLYGQHKEGYCFKIRLLVRPMPNLDNGFIQYVGLIIKVIDDYEYILTDMNGTISSMSEKLAGVFGIEHKWIHQTPGLNIQLLAPDLIPAYYEKENVNTEVKKQRKYREIGGEELLLVVPQGMDKWIAEGLAEDGIRKKAQGPSLSSLGHLPRFNAALNQRKKGKDANVTAEDLWNLDEYRNCALRTKVKCQIQDMKFAGVKSGINGELAKDTIRVRVLKISGLRLKKGLAPDAEINEEDLTLSNQEMYNKENELLSEYEREENKKQVINKDLLISGMMRKMCQIGNDNNSNGGSQGNKARSGSSDTDKNSGDKVTGSDSFTDLAAPEIAVRKSSKEEPLAEEKEIPPPNKASLFKKIQTGVLEEEKIAKEDNEEEDIIDDEGDLQGMEKYVTSWKEASAGIDRGRVNKGDATEKSTTRIKNEEEKKVAPPEVISIDLLDLPYVPASEVKPPPVKNTDPDANDFDEESITLLWVKKGTSRKDTKEDQLRTPQKLVSSPLPIPPDLGARNDLEVPAEEAKKITEPKIVIGEKSEGQSEPLINKSDLLQLEDLPLKEESKTENYDAKPSPQSEAPPKSQAGRPELSRIDKRVMNEIKLVNSVVTSMSPNRRRTANQESSFIPSLDYNGPRRITGKKIKIIDNPAYSTVGEVPIEEYVPTEHEIALRQYLYVHQMKEKKGREKERLAEDSKGEETDENQPLQDDAADDEDYNGEDNKTGENDDEGSVGSTSTNSTTRATFSIRAAVDEKFVPKSIKNMNIMTVFMFILVFVLAITYYVFELSLYSNIQENIINIDYSEQRQNWLIDINLRLRTLLAINVDNSAPDESLSILDATETEKSEMQAKANSLLKSSAVKLKDAQTQLNLRTSDMSPEQLDKINPNNVVTKYKTTTTRMPPSFIYTVSQTMLEIVVSSFKILGLPLSDLKRDEFSVFLIVENSLNSILVALKQSTNEIVSHIESSKNSNMKLFLLFLCVASGAAIISTIVLIPVIIYVKKNKEKVLSLFLHLSKDEMRKYQVKCERFKRYNKLVIFIPHQQRQQKDEQEEELKVTFSDKDSSAGSSQQEDNAGKENNEGGHKDPEEKKGPALLARKNSNSHFFRVTQLNTYSKNQKYKGIAGNFTALIFKILFFVTIIELFFALSYYFSYVFLEKVSRLVYELQLLISRAPAHSFLLLMQKYNLVLANFQREIIMYNATTQIEFQPSADFVKGYHSNMYGQEEQLLDVLFFVFLNQLQTIAICQQQSLSYGQLQQFIQEYSLFQPLCHWLKGLGWKQT
eukprot:TRINITY_DN333_c0_g1_i1.p1 TRINITY_DN333_c0_g1~~TRINITY_DN333_c0_g1_i1.p1  ORF type:complete len:1482 (-),score=192.52 TRINITY_DN333_c0_g1_i1:2885-7330(-)